MEATMPAQIIKRRGMSALNEQLKDGPVWVIANNTPKYVVLFADDFRRLMHESFVEGCLRSDAEYRAGQATSTTVGNLMSAFDDGNDNDV